MNCFYNDKAVKPNLFRRAMIMGSMVLASLGITSCNLVEDIDPDTPVNPADTTVVTKLPPPEVIYKIGRVFEHIAATGEAALPDSAAVYDENSKSAYTYAFDHYDGKGNFMHRTQMLLDYNGTLEPYGAKGQAVFNVQGDGFANLQNYAILNNDTTKLGSPSKFVDEKTSLKRNDEGMATSRYIPKGAGKVLNELLDLDGTVDGKRTLKNLFYKSLDLSTIKTN